MEYGNQDITGEIDSFWLDSNLEISALEQINFMGKLVREELPFEEKHQKTVKRMMIQDEQMTTASWENRDKAFGSWAGMVRWLY